MNAMVLAFAAGVGVYLVYSEVAYDNTHSGVANRLRQAGRSADDWMVQAGLGDTSKMQLCGTVIALFCFGGFVGWMLFGGVLAPAIAAVFSATFPAATYRQRRVTRRAKAADAWPRLIEETRLLCGSLGRPIPQAFLEAGKKGPVELRPAFVAAEREWLMSTDFEQTIAVIKEQLADPTADATCETLLIAHTVGGADVDRRLAALAKDRLADLNERKDARAKQSGVRFARRFVLVVPIGMAMAGMSIGNGRDAYSSSSGQFGVAIGLILLAACWYWAGRLIRIPDDMRVFRD